jgi:DNA-binding CsgD family transcriptional regulator
MVKGNPYLFIHYENEVEKICGDFLRQRGLSYFHYRRNYQDGSWFVLTNKTGFLKEFIGGNVKEISYPPPLFVHQSLVYFWDECLTEEVRVITQEMNSLYHGVTIVNRHKDHFDCAAFAMSQPHPCPSSYYLRIFHDLKTFSQLFPQMAKPMIDKVQLDRMYMPIHKQDLNRAALLLPRRSIRIQMSSQGNNYLTTYELFCIQLLNEGKSYKEIGEILSMSPRTVETHLSRMKRRTGLTLGEIAIKSFKMYGMQDSNVGLIPC